MVAVCRLGQVRQLAVPGRIFINVATVFLKFQVRSSVAEPTLAEAFPVQDVDVLRSFWMAEEAMLSSKSE